MEEDAKPVGKEEETVDHIQISLISQDGREVVFRLKHTTPFSKVVRSYCGREAVSPSSIRLLFDGRKISPDDTPASLEMENDDKIDVMLQQTGGGYI
jgi:small ubiquitin-related modifier